jgi:hypothetical protein
MKAYEMKGRKILFQWKGKEEALKCFVNDFNVEEGEAYFTLTTITGRTFKAKNGDFNWQDNEEDIEREARSAYTNLCQTREMYGSLPEEEYAKMVEIFKMDIIKASEETFEKKKEELIAYRIEKSKKSRQYYNENDLHVFYDIKHGNNVDNFQTVEEIEKMKKSFAKRDFIRGITELHHLQAFDKDFNLVIDEWNM